jgi:hypothetical protein
MLHNASLVSIVQDEYSVQCIFYTCYKLFNQHEELRNDNLIHIFRCSSIVQVFTFSVLNLFQTTKDNFSNLRVVTRSLYKREHCHSSFVVPHSNCTVFCSLFVLFVQFLNKAFSRASFYLLSSMDSTHHRCLDLPEIFSLILTEAHHQKRSGRTLSALARTCKSFSGPALDLLWYSQTSLAPLMLCLPSNSLSLLRRYPNGPDVLVKISIFPWSEADEGCRQLPGHSFPLITIECNTMLIVSENCMRLFHV